MARNGDNKPKIVVIRRGGGGGDGHHGGAWKIAYADFVTAMMAFFLVMWLINATTEQRRRGIANFFNPMASTSAPASQTMSDAGLTPPTAQDDTQQATHKTGNLDMSEKPDNGAAHKPGPTPHESKGAIAKAGGFGPDVAVVVGRDIAGSGSDTRQRGMLRTPDPSFPDRSIGRIVSVPPTLAKIVPIGGSKTGSTTDVGESGQVDAAAQEQKDLEHDAQQIHAAMDKDSAASQLAPQVKVELVPEGLRIQLSESDRRPMFDTGSARLNANATHLMQLIAPYLTAMPQNLSIYGYTDAATYRRKGESNWGLSAARADSAREILEQAGFPEQRLLEVSGRADRQLADPADPASASNRRVVLLLHREHDVPLPDAAATPQNNAPTAPAGAVLPAGEISGQKIRTD